MVSRLVLLAILCGILCAGAMCLPLEGAPEPPPALREADLIYEVGGGFAGIYHAVRITAEGQLFISDEHQPEVAMGFLSNSQGNQLNALLEDWDALPMISEEPICCDGFGYGITYRGRTLSWSEGQENVPNRLWEIAGLVMSFEQDLQMP